jgi:hypothetical protein
MIAEYAIVPDVFDPTGYSSAEVCDLHLSRLRDCLMSRGVVRDLHGGNWSGQIEAQRDRWHMRAKELLKKLKQQGRLCVAPACQETVPVDSVTWCREAIASHARSALSGIVADEPTAKSFESQDIVSSVGRLGQAKWWLGASNSIELQRTHDDYASALITLLRHSNSLMFVDPHLDPSAKQYGSFGSLLRSCGTNSAKPLIELHRVCYTGSGPHRRILSEQDCRNMFTRSFGSLSAELGLQIKVFVWDDFHDRFLISNLVGVSLPNGFDVDTGPPSTTRWTRIDREHRDTVQREFDTASKIHELRFSFFC